MRKTTIVFWCFSFWILPGCLFALEISDVPLESSVFTPPVNLMLVLDNSGSMDWEFMTPEEEGLFQGCLYLFPENAYQPQDDHRYHSDPSLKPMQRRLWRSQWVGYNRIYFNPHKLYLPWPSTQRRRFGPADLNRPWSNPLRTGSGNARIDLTQDFFSIRSGARDIRIANAHYFTHADVNHNGQLDSDEEIYLVTWVDENNDQVVDVSGNASADQRNYYRYLDDGDNRVEENELVPVTDEREKNLIRPAVVNADGKFVRFQTDREALQNFANWFTYYRRRFFTLKAVIADTITGLNHVNIGICAVNGKPRMGVRPVRVQADDTVQDHSSSLLDALYTMRCKRRTNLRSALDRVGRYFSREGRAGFDRSFNPPGAGGSCRRHVALVVSDGFWNGSFSGVGNADGNNGIRYADTNYDTLADVAAYYYDNDLDPHQADSVPVSGCAGASHQHMVTMSLSFGVNGTIEISDMDGDGLIDQPGYGKDPCLKNEMTQLLPWPRPVGLPGHEFGGGFSVGSGALLDDLLHAAINGRGKLYSMDDAAFLRRDLMSVPSQSQQEIQSGAFSLNQDRLNDTAILYRSTYDPTNWNGDVTAWRMGDEGSNVPFNQLIWRASDQFRQHGLNWDMRCVITSGHLDGQKQGVPFRYDYLNRNQRARLTQAIDHTVDKENMSRELIAYIRGAHFPHFRTRTSPLGDIVHSTPVVVGNTLFIGANDGMLHAFDARSGGERFAYVPNQVYGNLQDLSDPSYNGHHRFYVDGPLWAGDVAVARYQRQHYLVGALGKGGRGYFCLLTGARRRIRSGDGYGDYHWTFHVDQLGIPSNEEQASQIVQWDYPRIDPAQDNMDNNGNGTVDEVGEMDPDIGYAFGRGYAVNANSAVDTHQPVVIFGNGYNSHNQRAVLYVLTADRGEIVRKIDTGASMDNGLSTPALIDVNRDNRVDYAYAGDLHGNMWKFDLRANDPDFWGVAYGEDLNGDNIIDAAAGDLPQPLFQAKGQPITGRPDVMAMATACSPQATGYMVIFGTGRYLGIGDRSDTSQQSIYGIWDYGDDCDNSEYLGFLLDRSSGYLSSGLRLVRQTVTDLVSDDQAATRMISQEQMNYSTVEDYNDSDQNADPQIHGGWFLDFPVPPDPMADAGERVTGQVVIRGGKALITSLVPDQTPCSNGGSSWLYVLNGCNGTPNEGETNDSLCVKRYTGQIIGEPIVVKDPTRPRMDYILVPGSDGSIKMEAVIGEFWGQAYWWQNIQ